MSRTKLTQRKLAEALEISQPMVSRLKAAGMPTTTVAAATAWRAEHLDPVLSEARRFDKQVVTPAGTVPAPAAADAVPNSAADYLVARARREAAEAAKAELELAAMRNETCDRRTVSRGAEAAARLLRDRVLGIIPQVSARVAATSSQTECIAILTHELTRALQATADAGRELAALEQLGTVASQPEPPVTH